MNNLYGEIPQEEVNKIRNTSYNSNSRKYVARGIAVVIGLGLLYLAGYGINKSDKSTQNLLEKRIAQAENPVEGTQALQNLQSFKIRQITGK